MKPEYAKYIWYDEKGQGRNLYGLFRKTVPIKNKVKKATLNLFVDTAYILYINSQFVEFGPVRFDYRYPMYDVHDIGNYLVDGKNVIAILVNYFGCKTYKSYSAGAGMIAWGEIKTEDGEVIRLDTGSTGWVCKPQASRSRYASKMSFALNPVDIYEQCSEEKWMDVDFDDQNWPEAIKLADQNTWGELKPRNINFMDGSNDYPAHVEGIKVFPLDENIKSYSFQVPVPEYFEDEAEPHFFEKTKEFSRFILFSSWIYSPVAQSVTIGIYSGRYWLNGEEIIHSTTSFNKTWCKYQRWQLKQGWNYLFGKNEASYDIINQYLVLPENKGLVLSAEQTFNSQNVWKRSGLLKAEDYKEYLHQNLPLSLEDDIRTMGGWKLVTSEQIAHSPCLETGWDRYRRKTEILSPDELPGKTFFLEDYPEGFSLLIRLDQTRLFFPIISLKGIKGTTIDITYSEHLCEDNMHLYHQSNYPAGDRIICKNDKIEWMPAHPRGTLYLKLTFRNMAHDITIENIKLRSAYYPVQDKGWFKCSDNCLNNIWALGPRTLMMNMEDVYNDCPTRERGMYIRDLQIEYHINLATFGNQDLMHRCLQLYGQSPDSSGKFRSVFPNSGTYTTVDYALNMMGNYRSYYENTGDKNRIEEDWPSIMKNMAWFQGLSDEREDKLLDTRWYERRNLKDHNFFGGYHGDRNIKEGYMNNYGVHCAFSLEYLIALQDTIKLAHAINKEKDKDQLQQRAKILSHTIPAAFWDKDKSCFADTLKKNTHSIHANLLAVISGVVSNYKLDLVKEHVKNNFKNIFINGYSPEDGYLVSPSGSFYILEGLYRLDLIELAQNLIRQGWGWMLSQGYKTTLEYFSKNRNQSICHSWSASPTYYLSQNILGVTFPEAPDLTQVNIHVKAKGISEAEGAYPHPGGGLIEVKWHLEDGKRIFDNVKVPGGVKVRIIK